MRCDGLHRLASGFARWLALPACMVLAGVDGWCAPEGLTERIVAIESAGRAQPADAAASAADVMKQAPEGSAERLDLTTLRGLLLAASRQPEAARGVVEALQATADSAHAPAAALAARLVLARVETQGGDLHTADTLLSGPGATAVAALPLRARLRFVAAHAAVKKESGQLANAMSLYQDAVALADELLDPNWQVEVRCGLARVYLQAGQPDRAHRLNDEALQIAKRSGDEFALYRVHGTEAVLLDAGDDAVGMRREVEASLVHARLAGAPSAESLALSNLSDVYLKAAQYRTAIEMAEKSLPMTRRLGDYDGETVALFNIGVAHIGLHELDIGKRFVKESIAIDERRGGTSSMAGSYKELGQYLEAAGDAPGAVRAFHSYRTLADGIVQRDQQAGLVELQERFDAERRTRDLTLLNRENAIKSEQLRRQALHQDLWWLLAATSLLSLGTLLWLWRRVRRANRLLVDGNRELVVQSGRDPLTGLANRRHFQSVVTQYTGSGSFVGTLFVIDVDHFKRINDQHGHGIGDSVLIEVARRLGETMRDDDLIVRWGGEEFLVVARGIGASQVEALGRRMLAALAASPMTVQGRSIAVTASIGYASFPLAPRLLAVSVERAIKLVDGALYLAKAHGRNRAYGVLRLHAADERGYDAIAAALDVALLEGRIELELIDGPEAWKAAA